MNKKKTLWLCIVLVGAMLFSGCDELAGLLGDQENGEDPDGPSGSTDLSFYVSKDGDDGNDGLSKDTPFKTLLAAFEAARDSADRKQIVVRSDLSDADAVVFDGGNNKDFATITIKGKDGTQTITRSEVAIKGDGSVLEITGGAKITFENIKVNGMYNGGGSVFNRAIKIDGSEVTLGQGAVITGKLQGDSLDEYVGDNTVNGAPDIKNGSGIFVANSGKLTIADGSKVTNCEGPVNENKGTIGAVYANIGSNVLMSGGEISYNQARRGGGVAVYGTAVFTMTGGEIYKNIGTEYGGGIYTCRQGVPVANSPTLTLDDGEIYDNETTGNGGGIYTSKTLVAFTIGDGVVIRDNYAAESGGGIAAKATTTNNDKTIMMNGGEIRDNEAEMYGGGVFIDASAGDVSFTMNGGEISNNEATYGGGVYLKPYTSSKYTATFTLTDGDIYGSGSAKPNIITTGDTNKGAAIYKEGGSGPTKVKTPKEEVSNTSSQNWEDTIQ
jgi:predicted outer membrane repeat protein